MTTAAPQHYCALAVRAQEATAHLCSMKCKLHFTQVKQSLLFCPGCVLTCLRTVTTLQETSMNASASLENAS